MKRFTSKRGMLPILCVCTLLVCCFASCVNRMAVSFDSLYPNTPFKTTLCSCCRVLQDFDLLQNKKCERCDYEVFTDLIVGKLFHIKMSIDNIRLQKPAAHPEDIAFLEDIFDKVLCDYKCTCSCYLDKPKSGYVVQLIGDIKSKCKSLR